MFVRLHVSGVSVRISIEFVTEDLRQWLYGGFVFSGLL